MHLSVCDSNVLFFFPFFMCLSRGITFHLMFLFRVQTHIKNEYEFVKTLDHKIYIKMMLLEQSQVEQGF